ncbi:MAG: phosphatase PAP2 family protein [Candidatus Woesebacteria bacterium]
MNFLIIFGAKYLYIVITIVAGIAFLLSAKKIRENIVRLTIFAFPISFLLAKFLSFFINDPRPFVVEKIQPLIQASADNGFPSDHTLLATTIALVIYTHNRRIGSILFIFALLVGEARVLAKAHHYEDVIGSMVISIVAVTISNFLVKKVRFKLPIID